MNTTKKGTEFELLVFDYFKNLINNEELAGVSKRSKIFHQKRYQINSYRDIIFDITIENYASKECEERGEWSSIIVIECKNYSSIVDIGKLDEFQSKATSLSQYSVKPYFVASSGFSKTVINQARDKHIGLIVFTSDCNANWIVYRDTRHNRYEEYNKILLGDSLLGCSPLVYEDGNYMTILDMLRNNNVDLKRKPNVKFLSNEYLKQLAQDIYNHCGGSSIDSDIAGCVLAKLFPYFRITFSNQLPQGCYGETSFETNVITISQDILTEIHRRNFTLAHELGHIILHNEILGAIENHGMHDSATLQKLDCQANKFSSYILMPKDRFKYEVSAIFKKYSITRSTLVYDDQPINKTIAYHVLDDLSNIFHVSKEAVRIRLCEDGYMQDLRRRPQRIGDFFRH